MTAAPDPDLRRRKIHEAALVLPFAGVFLLMPPFIRIFVSGGSLGGIPTIIVYLFGVWFALILSAWLLSRPLRAAMLGEADGGDAQGAETRAVETSGADDRDAAVRDGEAGSREG